MKFKIGDRVKIIRDFGWLRAGQKGRVVSLDDGVEWENANGRGHKCGGKCPNNNGYYVPPGDLELLKPMRKINYILSYDTPQRDPIEYFEKLSEVEARIDELIRQNGALLDTIQVFEVKAVGKVRGIKIDIKFER